jgi:hypothetical protein
MAFHLYQPFNNMHCSRLLSSALQAGLFFVTVGSLCAQPVDRVVVSLSDQAFAAYSSGHVVLSGPISTGQEGFETPPGEYRVTSKHRDHVSNLYDVEMPFFLRFNGSALGMHEGLLPGFPASHGCIRVQRANAEKLFSMADVGTHVSIVRDSTEDTFGIPQPPPIIRYYRMVKGKRVFLSNAEAKAYKSSRPAQKSTAISRRY